MADGAESRGRQACTDHEGRGWPSFSRMCRAWGISPATAEGRMRRGWSLERALTQAPRARRGRAAAPATDHEGKEWPSVSAMCRAWGVGQPTYAWRIAHGWSVRRALTEGPRWSTARGGEAVDHEGTRYGTMAAMAEAWGLDYATVHKRLKRGWPVERALTERKQLDNVPNRGDEGVTAEGVRARLAAYRRSTDCDVELEDGTFLAGASYGSLVDGRLRHPGVGRGGTGSLAGFSLSGFAGGGGRQGAYRCRCAECGWEGEAGAPWMVAHWEAHGNAPFPRTGGLRGGQAPGGAGAP